MSNKAKLEDNLIFEKRLNRGVAALLKLFNDVMPALNRIDCWNKICRRVIIVVPQMGLHISEFFLYYVNFLF